LQIVLILGLRTMRLLARRRRVSRVYLAAGRTQSCQHESAN